MGWWHLYGYMPGDIEPWEKREMDRFEDRVYLEVPWEGERWFLAQQAELRHYTHISREDPKMIAYTPNKKYGEQDRQIKARPGKYLARFYSGLGPQELESAVSKWKALIQHDLLIAMTSKEIAKVYVDGPSSCMSSGGWFPSDFPMHPTGVYGAGDLGVAYFMDPVSNIPAARTLVWPAKKIYSSSLYGDWMTLKALLELKAGFRQATHTEFSGAKLLRVPVPWDENKLILPFLDIGGSTVTDTGKTLLLGYYPTRGMTHEGSYTCGYTEPDYCDYCEEYIAEEISTSPNGGRICEPCLQDRYPECERCGEPKDEVDIVEISQSLAIVCESCFSDHYLECQDCDWTGLVESFEDGYCPDCYETNQEEDTDVG